ncbi:multi-sensor hybrid histidine kinase [Chloroherpeton thalassium ATCC 35110]|uniref:histidine kinase n=1 Tax=Chloroherpeton thalassium (strain ATCC 35110 / GB-78) TaxID=517418 RepID=B3QVC1_CHLT3|nr:response regulator [Chloroherpeton thalassium]ACF13075.1 multi-sensor hybrid histidine kinase [Chloroherpeton thalassium ATCC 35110]
MLAGLRENIVAALVSLFFVFASTSAYAQNYRSFTYSNDQGLASNLTKAILQDENGGIWIGTDAGLAFYDGQAFSTQAQGLPSLYVKDLVMTASHRILVITDMGIGYLAREHTDYEYRELIHGGEAPTDSTVFFPKTAFEDSEGTLWISEPQSITRYSNGLLRRYYFEDVYGVKNNDFRSFLFAEDHYGRLMVASNNGQILYFDPIADAFRVLPLEKPAESFQINVFKSSKQRGLWVGSNLGLYKFEVEENFLNAAWKKVISLEDISSLAIESNGKMFIGTWLSGLYTWNPYSRNPEPQKITALPFNFITGLFIDRQNSLWVASDEGVGVVQETAFSPLAIESGNFFVRSVVATTANTILAVAHHGIFEISQNDGDYQIDKVFTNGTGRFYQPAGDSNGVWIAYHPGSISLFKRGKEIKTIKLGKNRRILRDYWPNQILSDKYSNIWTCQSGREVIRIDSTVAITTYGYKKGIVGKINVIKEVKNGKLYLGGSGGNSYLYEYDRVTDAFRNLSIELPVEKNIPFIVYDLDVDSKNTVWLGTSQGIFKYDRGRVVRDNIPNEIGKPVIKALAIDRYDRIWLGTEQGLLFYADGGVTRFTKQDGLPSSAIVHRALAFDKQSRLWVGTTGGLAYWQDGLPKVSKTPKPNLRAIFADEQPLALTAKNINSGKYANDVALKVSFVSLSYPGENLLYQTRLLGLQPDWSSPTPQTHVLIPPLPPGDYVLQIRAQQAGNLWSDVREYRISVAPSWYAQRWMGIVYVMILAGALVFLRKFRNTLREKSRADEEHQKLISLIELSSECILMVSLNGRVDFINAAGQWLLGVDANGEVAGGTWSHRIFEFIHEEDSIFFRRIVVPAVINQGQWSGELHFQHMKTKQQIPVLCSAFTIKHPVTGKPMAYAAISSDITIRKKVERELIEAREEALRAAQAKAEFLANMSHEIRTPMNAVIGMTGLLLDTPLTAEQREYVETIRSSGDALLTVINDILDFSKIESGKLELEQYPFTLRNAIEECIDIFSATAAEKHLELVYFIHEKVPTKVSGDVTRLRQILVNLVSNAVKFTKSGEVVLEVQLQQPREQNADERLMVFHDHDDDKYNYPQAALQQFDDKKCTLHFTVRDTGIGIPADRLERIFHSFSQVDASTTRKYGGTGLGLTISKHLCELMNGKMWVESELGKGSTFHFTITLERLPDTKGEYSSKLAGKHALIVDDNATNRRILSLQSATWGMSSHTVGSGKNALELIHSGMHFDVGILDFHMPEMDGLMLAMELRKLPQTQDLPLVMLTSAGNRETVSETVGVGFSAFLNKPIKQSQLYDVLTDVFQKGELPVREKPKPKTKVSIDLAREIPLRILIAEDNVVNQKLVLRILEKVGYRADVAANGAEVIEALKSKTYDLILMDVQMPEMDGLTATRYICQNWPRLERPFIIAMTANAMKGDREACLEAGMDDYLSKPVRFDDLQKALDKWGHELEHKNRTGARLRDEQMLAPSKEASRNSQANVALSRQEIEPDTPVIDPYTLACLRDMCQGNSASKLSDIIDMFISDTNRQIGQLGQSTNDAESISHLAHSLKGSCLMVGATQVADVCLKIEKLGKSGRTDGIEPLLVQLKQNFEIAQTELLRLSEEEPKNEKTQK